jgi:hypothetical protein
VRRSLLSVVLAAALSGCLTPAPAPLPAQPLPYSQTVSVVAQPLPLDPRDPSVDGVGDFRFGGAVALTSPDTSRFHGFSDLQIVGDRLYSVGDDGAEALDARLKLAPDGKVAGLEDARLAPLRGADGQPLQNKEETDAEGLAILPNGDRLYSFERDHRILRYPADGGPPVRAPMPPVAMPNNDGMEGLSPARKVGRDAYWVGIEDDGQVWLCRLSATCRKVEGLPAPPKGYRLSALTETPSGDLVLLHHWFERPFGNSHIDVSVVRAPLTAPRVVGRFRLDSPMTVDNFEGVAVTPWSGGRQRFYFLVDDNFLASQKTILLALDWSPPK